MKDKFKENYLLEFYRNHLLDICQGNMYVWDYIARFDDLTLRCDVREDCYQTISRFCSGLRSDIQRVMLTISDHVNSIEEPFHLALELELSFKGIFFPKLGSSVLSVRNMDTMITSAPRRVNMLILFLVMMLTTRRLLRMSTFLRDYECHWENISWFQCTDSWWDPCFFWEY